MTPLGPSFQSLPVPKKREGDLSEKTGVAGGSVQVGRQGVHSLRTQEALSSCWEKEGTG